MDLRAHLLKCHLKGKASKKLANGQNIDYSEKRKWPKGFICPCTGVKYHNIQTCLLVYAADSGEHLQDHWSSGSDCATDFVYNNIQLQYHITGVCIILYPPQKVLTIRIYMYDILVVLLCTVYIPLEEHCGSLVEH